MSVSLTDPLRNKKARRVARALALPFVLAFAGTSSTPVDPFVTSGEFARAYEAVASCETSFFPALDPGDREQAMAIWEARGESFERLDDGASGLFRFASMVRPRFLRAGQELPYTYRPLPLAGASITRTDERDSWAPLPESLFEGMSESDAAEHLAEWESFRSYDYLDMAPGARLDSYESETIAMAGSAMETESAGCTRIYVQVERPTMQVGIPAGNSVWSQDKFISLILGALPPARRDSVRTAMAKSATPEAVDPDKVINRVTVKAYRNAEAARGEDLRLHVDPRANPGRYGATFPHLHLAHGGVAMPTVRIGNKDGQTAAPGTPVTVRTDDQGEAFATIKPGYRGGPEAVIASAVDPRAGFAPAARAVVVRHQVGLVHFASSVFGPSTVKAPPPSERYPFLMVGWTRDHPNNHFVRAEYAPTILRTLRGVWENDAARSAAARATGQAHYMVLNDMSLEYGGLFKIGGAGSCSNPNVGAHKTHLAGIDFDISPCYTWGKDGQLQRAGADQCERSNSILKIDERVLAAWVIGMQAGAVFEHRKTPGAGVQPDGADYHYHVRIPLNQQDRDRAEEAYIEALLGGGGPSTTGS